MKCKQEFVPAAMRPGGEDYCTATTSDCESVVRRAISAVGTPYMASEAMLAETADAMYGVPTADE